MSRAKPAVTSNLYSVHWENDKAHGYFRRTIRILAKDAADAVIATRPEDATGNAHVVSVDLLAEGIVLLIAKGVLTEAYESGGPYSDGEYREMLGTADGAAEN